MESIRDAQRMSKKANQKELFIFAKVLLHDYDRSLIEPDLLFKMQTLLNCAPISGSGRPKEIREANWVWDNRWRTYDEKPDYEAYGNGLDYMLAHNVYMLLFSERD